MKLMRQERAPERAAMDDPEAVVRVRTFVTRVWRVSAERVSHPLIGPDWLILAIQSFGLNGVTGEHRVRLRTAMLHLGRGEPGQARYRDACSGARVPITP